MKKKAHIILGIIQSFVAIGALPAGLSMILHHDGSQLGMSIEFLQDSPFKDFFIPGLFLFIFNGIFHLVAAIFSFFKSKYAGTLGVLLGAILALWIVLQVCFISLISFMQPLFFFIGLIEIIISLRIIKQKNIS